MKLQMCRICLVEDVAMMPIAKTPLQEIYEKLTAMNLETNTSRPIIVCYMCYARLQNCYYLRNSCLCSEEIFTLMLLSNNKERPFKPQAALKLNLLKITPVINVSICDIVHTKDKAGSGNEGIKMETILTEEINIKKEDHDISDAEEFSVLEIPNIEIKVDMDGGQDNGTGDDNTTAKELEPAPIFAHSSSKLKRTESAETKNKEELLTSKYHKTNEVIITDATAKKLDLTTLCFAHSSSELKTTESAETKNKEELLTSKSHKTNEVLTCTLISEEKILDELENTIELRENIVTYYDVIKQSQTTDCFSHARIKPSRRYFSTKAELKTHLHQRYKCDICNKQFNHKFNLVTHLRTHTDKRPYTCNICNELFNEKSNLVKHLSSHTDEKRHKCSICCKQYKQKGSLLAHIRSHTGEKPFKCDICNKQFSRNGTLVVHLHTHTDARLHKCDICNKRFKRKGNLTRHLRTHFHTHTYTHTDARPYKCDICHKQLKQKAGLVQHLRIHSGEKPFKCGICNKQFSVKCSLVTHLRTHTGERPYKCDICNKQFIANSHFVRHIRKHTGKGPYKCDICNTRFIDYRSLVKHLRIHTGQKS